VRSVTSVKGEVTLDFRAPLLRLLLHPLPFAVVLALDHTWGTWEFHEGNHYQAASDESLLLLPPGAGKDVVVVDGANCSRGQK